MGKTGVVILNYITWQQTERCIKSLKETENADELQIYVVDNASPEKGELRRVCREAQVELIENPDNSGYAAGNNVGIVRALADGCDYIVISNNDIEYRAGCLARMRDFLEGHFEYGIVGPKILTPEGTLQRCHYKKKTGYGDIWGTQTILRYVMKKPTDALYGDEQFYLHEQEVFAVSGCCFMLRAACARKIAPLDEHTFLYEEENIIGMRMEKEGWKTGYLPASEVVHNHDQTTRLVKPFALICWACSEVYYCREYLGCGFVKIRLMYWYRTLIFLLHGLRNKAYREQWSEYRKETGKYLRQKEWD